MVATGNAGFGHLHRCSSTPPQRRSPALCSSSSPSHSCGPVLTIRKGRILMISRPTPRVPRRPPIHRVSGHQERCRVTGDGNRTRKRTSSAVVCSSSTEQNMQPVLCSRQENSTLVIRRSATEAFVWHSVYILKMFVHHAESRAEMRGCQRSCVVCVIRSGRQSPSQSGAWSNMTIVIIRKRCNAGRTGHRHRLNRGASLPLSSHLHLSGGGKEMDKTKDWMLNGGGRKGGVPDVFLCFPKIPSL